MFTGLVEELGTVAALEDQGDAIRLTIDATTVLGDAGLGDSIAVNGCCLTVAERTDTTWTADVMQETLDMTSLMGVAPGDRVNLERAMTPDKRLGGHLVQGHVDGVGAVVRRTTSDHWEVVEISLPAELARYLGPRCSTTHSREPSGKTRWRPVRSTTTSSPFRSSAIPLQYQKSEATTRVVPSSAYAITRPIGGVAGG